MAWSGSGRRGSSLAAFLGAAPEVLPLHAHFVLALEDIGGAWSFGPMNALSVWKTRRVMYEESMIQFGPGVPILSSNI